MDDGIIVTTEGIDSLVRALRAEEDGKPLRRELGRNMGRSLQPAAADAKAGIMSMASAGMGTSPALRPTIAAKIRPEVKLGGRWTGARIRARKTPGLRGFANAPKRTQSAKGWRVQTYGNGTWRVQHGKVEWFDRAMAPHRGEYMRAVHEAMDAMARRIAERSHR